ncbi:hypothetical protein OCU04_010554 [Sclerotinia nivalis]|uniref:Uncharacterized protein n=1 Tax=Sclerotinia nivalis TaxID=352851 RepID=A0A9X0DE54_9HELO|nr:hypothetical protein OCU04_010554 [Sclerotinia nivalis]
MPTRPARPSLIRRNAQYQVPLTAEAQNQAGRAQLDRPVANSDERPIAQASSSELVDDETQLAEYNALVAEQREYLQRYQENRAAEAAQAPEVSQQFDAAAMFARIEREQAAVDSLPPHVRRTRSEEFAWTHRHIVGGSLSQHHSDVYPGPQALDAETMAAGIYNARIDWVAQNAQASFASSSSSAMRPDTPRPDTPRPDTSRPVFSRTQWSSHSRQDLRLNPYAAPFVPRRQLAVNLLASVQEGEEEVGQGFEIIDIGTPSAENGEKEPAVDSENATIAESSTSVAANTSAATANDHSWYERMVDQIVGDYDDDNTAIYSYPTAIGSNRTS